MGQGAFKGEVRAVAFAGETREYVLDTDIGFIKASSSVNDPMHNVGEHVSFDMQLEGARALGS